jgi:hypothetical protein
VSWLASRRPAASAARALAASVSWAYLQPSLCPSTTDTHTQHTHEHTHARAHTCSLVRPQVHHRQLQPAIPAARGG